MWNSISVTRFCTLNWDFTLNRDSLRRDFTVWKSADRGYSLNRGLTVRICVWGKNSAFGGTRIAKKNLAVSSWIKPSSQVYVHIDHQTMNFYSWIKFLCMRCLCRRKKSNAMKKKLPLKKLMTQCIEYYGVCWLVFFSPRCFRFCARFRRLDSCQ